MLYMVPFILSLKRDEVKKVEGQCLRVMDHLDLGEGGGGLVVVLHFINDQDSAVSCMSDFADKEPYW